MIIALVCTQHASLLREMCGHDVLSEMYGHVALRNVLFEIYGHDVLCLCRATGMLGLPLRLPVADEISINHSGINCISSAQAAR